MTSASTRQYDHTSDYEAVNRLLVETYRTDGGQINWPQPRWEYMHFHPLIWEVDLGAIGVWETAGRIVGVAHPEHRMGTSYFQVDPGYGDLKGEMLSYAEARVSTVRDGVRSLRVLINDEDEGLWRVASEMGYVETDRRDPMSHFDIRGGVPRAHLPKGFRLKSLADDNDLEKVDRALWRGFDHGDDPPEDGLEGRKFMQSAPNFRKDLTVVVEAPDGNFVSYAGMWYEPVHSIAYVEPVATDPAFRRMGLGRAAVMEGVRRCGELGATVACVGSTRPFYTSMGFRQVYSSSFWQREWT